MQGKELAMRQLKDKEYKIFEDIKHIRNDGSEFWSARELAPTLKYNKWENFHKVIKRAMIACENSGISFLRKQRMTQESLQMKNL